MDINKLELLLQEVYDISLKYELLSKNTGYKFNIFEIIGIQSDEVEICKFIYELLNPRGSHGQGYIYLKYFFRDVLNIQIADEKLQSAKIYREYVIKNNRRIDLFICVDSYSIPIEVKIYAGEQQNQCFDYLSYAKHSNLYYLTRFGDFPSEYSTKNLKESKVIEKISCISFEREILTWLKHCVEEENTVDILPVRELILQLIRVIGKFTNKLEDKMEIEIIDIITKNSENMKNAIDIKNAVDKARVDLMKRLFSSIENKIKENLDVDKLINEYDYSYDNFKKCNGYYSYKSSSTCPGISYLYKKNVKDNVDVWVRIEIDEHIFVGYCSPFNDKFENKQLIEMEIQDLGITPRQANWWLYWEYVFQNETNSKVNFKNSNEAYFNLFNKDYEEKFVNECTEKVMALLK